MTIGELALRAHVDVNDTGIVGEDFVSLLWGNFFIAKTVPPVEFWIPSFLFLLAARTTRN